MSPAKQKYVLDANVIIDGLRKRDEQVRLIQFHTLFAPFEYLSAVVVQELKAGAMSRRDIDGLEKHIFAPFVRRGRLVTPSYSAWETSGEVLRSFARDEGLDVGTVSKSFGNDILLALSCREAGLTLVTRNTRDFARIRRMIPFRFAAPWPVPIG